MKSGNKFNLQILLVLLGLVFIILMACPYLKRRYENDRNGYEYKNHFLKFLDRFNKSYKKDDVEYRKRFENFKVTLSFIEKANSAKHYGENVQFGLTKFSDMTDDEFKREFLNDEKTTSTKYRLEPITQQQQTEKKQEQQKNYSKYVIPKKLPLKIDWVERGIVTGIRNQGNCGSCYAQSVIGTIESSVTLHYNLTKPLALSVQQMIDCAGNFNQGCLGGDTCDLLEWLKGEEIKILPYEFYPSETKYNEKRNCKNVTLPDDVKTAKVLKYTCLDFTGYEHEILNILANKGPLAASVNGLLWKNYLGGVIKYHCNGPSNHAIEIVGYDLSQPDPHYIVRNSWGTEFGNDGYAKIAFGENVCNIATEISMVQVEWC